MTEAEALDMAARAAGWDDFADFTTYYHVDDLKSIRAHAKTIVAMAELMTTCEEATTRMELMHLQHQKVVDENAALKAENEALKALRDDDGELLTIAWMDGAHRSNKAHREKVEALEARVAGLTQERDFHRETADLHADRIAALKAENERLRSTSLTDVELEAACHAVGIFLFGPDAERFEKMFDAAMTARTALERIDHGDR